MTKESKAILGLAVFALLIAAMPFQWALVAYESSILWSYLAEPMHWPVPSWAWFWVLRALIGTFQSYVHSEADSAAEKKLTSDEKMTNGLIRAVTMFVLYPAIIGLSICVASVFRAQGWL